MTKIRNFSLQKPILFSFIISAVFFLCLKGSGALSSLFPENTLFTFLDESIDILWPIALTFLCGYGFIYNKKGFGTAIVAGMAPLVIYSLFTLLTFLRTLAKPDTQWQTLPVILVGILSLIGVGLREEVIFRGIIGNALTMKCGTSRKGLWFAVILSSALFGCFHIMNIFSGAKLTGVLVQMFGASIGGLLYMAIYLRGGNIWAAALIHGLNDAVGLFATTFTVTTVTEVEIIGDYSLSGENLIGLLIPLSIEVIIALFLLRKSKLPAIFARLEQLRAVHGVTAENK